MEGALAGVIAGLGSTPVIALPTSIGYGAAFGGLLTLLGMPSSCTPGISMVKHRQRLLADRQANFINQLPGPEPGLNLTYNFLPFVLYSLCYTLLKAETPGRGI